MLDVRLRLTASGHDGLAHWFTIELLPADAAVVLDADRFRFPVVLGRRLLNPPDDSLNPPPDWQPDWSPLHNVNGFAFPALADLAARHFLRRQGLEPGGRADASVVTPTSVAELTGRPDADADLTARRLAMAGAEIAVRLPTSGELHPVSGPAPGTVTTIATDYDGNAVNGTGGDDTSTTLGVGFNTSSAYRGYIRFPLAAIPDSAVVDNVDLRLYVSSIGGSAPVTVDLQPYHASSRGLTDPQPDSLATRFARCVDAATPYVNNTGVLGTTGSKTLDLGTTADADVRNALASDRFSVALNEDSMASGVHIANLAAIEHATQEEAKLVVTHRTPLLAQAFVLV